MFKKLVVGALATGIALTGGIGAASADTQKAVSSPK
ncbi:LCI fold-containing protein, partial [Bacillus sp. D-CC]